MKKLIPIFLLLLIPSITGASLVDFGEVQGSSYCINDTIKTVKNVKYCEDANCTDVQLNSTHICQYGCIEPEPGAAKCAKSPFTKNLVVLGVIASIIITIYIFTRWWY